ncbi:hypothetical protein BC938DRAFT_479755 [Jimgerdemannia flammicorona]|uniref:Uncharacterized protein n=1 Tax=Jimgerdemannia flammicorona TaxID=994334 RepID=A0A433QXK3_9FUNG|nr:hypothetical protein BC938DRAFT_479755 [Jimgerdemannia flammicorona]
MALMTASRSSNCPTLYTIDKTSQYLREPTPTSSSSTVALSNPFLASTTSVVNLFVVPFLHAGAPTGSSSNGTKSNPPSLGSLSNVNENPGIFRLVMKNPEITRSTTIPLRDTRCSVASFTTTPSSRAGVPPRLLTSSATRSLEKSKTVRIGCVEHGVEHAPYESPEGREARLAVPGLIVDAHAKFNLAIGQARKTAGAGDVAVVQTDTDGRDVGGDVLSRVTDLFEGGARDGVLLNA